MARHCALCYIDTSIAHWNNPDPKRVTPLGTSQSNWACDKCLGKPHNKGWRNTPSEEVYGIEGEQEVISVPVPDSEPGPFETVLCIEIMRRYCLGQTQRSIAADVETSLSVVTRTVRYWKTNYGHFLEMVKDSLSKKGRVIQ